MWKGILLAIAEWVHTCRRVLLDLLYPLRCAGCGQVGKLFCDTCHSAISFVIPPVCPLCGRPQEQARLCLPCTDEPLSIDGIRSVARFEGTLRRAIHQFKYSYTRDMAVPLAEMLVTFCRRTRLPADVILPVPLHVRRLKERGYNQAGLLAQRLGDALGMPVLYDALYRIRHTVSQTRLDAQERRRNVEGAFACVGSGVQDRRVLLIDDVCTTGATLEACSVALKAGGARSVWALTLARPG
jgi:ComF family protein